MDFHYALYHAFRMIVPEAHDRIPLTWSNGIFPVLCYLPFLFLAYLSRRPDTYLIRLLLLPIVVTLILVAAYRFTWTIPELNVYNWGQCLFAAVAISKSLEFSLQKRGMLKIGESHPGVKKNKAKETQIGNGHVELDNLHHHGTWYADTFEVVHTLRGLGWKFGQHVHVPKESRPLERSKFLEATFKSFVKNFLLLDVLESTLKVFPGVGMPSGGSMFYADLAPMARYATSTVIHLLTGAAILSGFGMVYDLITLFAVGALNHSPLYWPPVMDDPWHAESMHDFWSKHWHQQLRQTFLIFGGYPGKWLAGNVGMLFGMFIASGLFHECAMYSMARGLDHAAVVFFAGQGVVLILERWWRRLTGHRVGGRLGRLWVYFILFVCGQPMIDSWHRRGLGGGMVIPGIVSPARWIIAKLYRI